jgi:uncharacterized FAD-dependent dehydrogenase
MDINSNSNKMKKIVVIGAGVAGINFATKLVDNGYDGKNITIIDMGKDPHNRLPEETMTGMLGSGGWSDGKLVVSTSQGGQLSKYCGETKAYDLMQEVVENFRRFHPKPEEIFLSNPLEEPEFIKPKFTLRMSPVWHIGSNFLHEIAKNWYSYLVDKGVDFRWEEKVTKINFKHNIVVTNASEVDNFTLEYDELIFAVGKSGIDFAQQLAEQYELPDEPKSVQIGVRFEAPQKYFQKMIDVSYDFKLYQSDDKVSIRSFCTNNNAAYVAVEETYGNISYNGHAKKGEEFRNNLTNFGIIMEIKGIENPFEWSRNVVNQLQRDGKGLYYSPSRKPGTTSEGKDINAYQISDLQQVRQVMGEYWDYVESFILDMKEIFEFSNDWGVYIPEVKYLSPEPLVKYDDLSLTKYPNVHFVGDALSARGITVSGAHGIYVAESLLRDKYHHEDIWYDGDIISF